MAEGNENHRVMIFNERREREREREREKERKREREEQSPDDFCLSDKK